MIYQQSRLVNSPCFAVFGSTSGSGACISTQYGGGLQCGSRVDGGECAREVVSNVGGKGFRFAGDGEAVEFQRTESRQAKSADLLIPFELDSFGQCPSCIRYNSVWLDQSFVYQLFGFEGQKLVTPQESSWKAARASAGHVLHVHLPSMVGQRPSRSHRSSVQDSTGKVFPCSWVF